MLVFVGLVAAGEYVRPPAGRSLDVSLSNNYTPTSPQQVHISLAGDDKMRISWITHIPTPSTVKYGTSQGMYNASSTGTSSSYRYIVYRSGQIHDVVIGPLEPSTTYYYKCGYDSSPEYSFRTPPAQLPITFAVTGDLGQTVWTRSTLQHIGKSGYDVLLNPGDLAYADYYQPFWDSFGHLVEPLASQRPWMVTQGNHEVERIPVIHNERFTAYNARWHMPFEESGSKSNLFYSFDVSGVHVIMLGSYTNFELNSDQYKWLESDLRKVDRTRTPWLFVLVHAPWYNSNVAHQGEKESTRMKDTMETLLYNAHVDIVFAGHVHAYERFARVYKDEADKCGPIHITIGDGGNREGLATRYKDPQPKISMFREASFGHGQLRVVNGSHAQWTWHRNDDVQPDSVWFTSLASDSGCVV
ncbi:probable purple acid phosphatase 20 [Cynara cardunculus var. scolymus]|uniref:probable purple acid phosphatase 20 n=1 Tax=Cynara cardunculus var. scolymus TaxID=59895 RepID=UPI000D630C50|nr:probable purple acid phosphatase 20 [Cynara cardunculus var. scolymus]